MGTPIMDAAEQHISRAFLAAAIRRDPALAEAIRSELRTGYPGDTDPEESKAIEIALTLVDQIEQRAGSSLEAPPGAPRPR